MGMVASHAAVREEHIAHMRPLHSHCIQMSMSGGARVIEVMTRPVDAQQQGGGLLRILMSQV